MSVGPPAYRIRNAIPNSWPAPLETSLFHCLNEILSKAAQLDDRQQLTCDNQAPARPVFVLYGPNRHVQGTPVPEALVRQSS